MFLAHKLLRVFKGTYTPDEIAQIEGVQTYYKKYMSDQKLPDEVNILSDTNRRLSPTEETYNSIYWLNANVGNLGREAYDMITIVCDYQQSRDGRTFGGGPQDDPIHLTLHELKNWLVKLAQMPFEPTTLAEVKSRCSYLEALFMDPDLFKKGKFHEMTMKGTLINVYDILKDKVIQKIKTEIANQCAHDKLSILIRHLTGFFHNSIIFLYYIFRDSEPANISIKKIEDAQKEEDYALKLLRDLVKSQSGNLILNKLSESEPIDSTLKDIPGEFIKEGKQEVSAISPETKAFSAAQSNIETSIFSEENSFLYENNEPISLSQYLLSEKTNTGTSRLFKTDEIAIKKYIQACGYLQELGRFCITLKLAKECAKLGGDLLLFGFMRNTLEDHLRDLADWLYLTNKTLVEIRDLAKEEAKKLSATDKALTQLAADAIKRENKKERYWTVNLLTALEIFNRNIAAEHNWCFTSIEDTRAAANSIEIKELFAKTKEASTKYATYAFQHSNYIRKKLGKPALENPHLQRQTYYLSNANLISFSQKKSLLLEGTTNNSTNPYILFGKALAEMESKNYINAINILKIISIEKFDDNVKITFYISLANAYHQVGNLKEALSNLHLLITISNINKAEFCTAKLLEGDILITQEKWKEAKEAYQCIVNKADKSLNIYNEANAKLNSLKEQMRKKQELLEQKRQETEQKKIQIDNKKNQLERKIKNNDEPNFVQKTLYTKALEEAHSESALLAEKAKELDCTIQEMDQFSSDDSEDTPFTSNRNYKHRNNDSYSFNGKLPCCNIL